MTNTELLKEKIKKCGYRIDYVATQAGISYQAFYNKAENRTEFLASEIMKISELLKLTDDERNDIFFVNSVNINHA